MKNKLILLALSVIALVPAVPAVASAGEPVVDPGSGKFPLTFTASGGHSELRIENEPGMTCTALSSTGRYSSSTTGEISLTFHGCTTSFFGFPVSCNSPGQPSGTIKFNASVFHNTYLTDAKTTPGILITPPTGGIFTTIICGTFAKIEVKGNGVIGHLEAPKCGEKRKTATLNFSAVGTTQSFRQVTATGISYSLTGKTESETLEVPAALVAEATLTNAEEATLTCV